MDDKNKVAKVIADMLGASTKGTPEQSINDSLRSMKAVPKELKSTLKKMLDLASQVGIKYDKSLVKEGAIEVDSGASISDSVDVMQPAPIMRYKEYMKKKTAPHMDNHEDDPHTEVGSSMDDDKLKDDDQLRRRKVDYKLSEDTDILDEDLQSADYKISKSGHKYRSHHINFANSKSGSKLADDPEEDDDENEIREEYEDCDISDEELEDIADDIDDEEDILDVYDDDELEIIDSETGEEVEDEELDESLLSEVLSKQERMRARIRFMKYKARRQRKLQIALKKRSDTKTLMRRARKLAVKLLKTRLLKKDPKDMTVAEKERAEKMVQQRSKTIDRLAMRLMPRIRKIESERLSHQSKK